MLLPKARQARALRFAFPYLSGVLALLIAPAISRAEASIEPYGHVPDAQRTIAMKMPAFRRCFERMHASGRVSLTMTIVRDGAVTRALVEGPVPRIVARCIESQALGTTFSEPEGGRTVRLQVPVSFIRQ